MKPIHWLCFMMFFLPSSGYAQKNEESIRAEIRSQMMQRHPSIPPGFWEGLGPEALTVIRKMYQENPTAYEKGFLIDGLSHFKDPDTGKFLELEVSNTQNEVMRKKLLGALIQSQGEKSFDFVEPYLKDESPHVRLMVAKELSKFSSSDRIKKRLDAYSSSEKKDWVLKELKAKPAKSMLQKKAGGYDPGSSSTQKLVREPVKAIPPLPEKSWAGLWRGTYLTETKMTLVDANLTLVDAKAKPLVWKVEFKMPDKTKQEWKQDEFTLHYFQTQQAHWIEIRNAAKDVVFLAQRKAK